MATSQSITSALAWSPKRGPVASIGSNALAGRPPSFAYGRVLTLAIDKTLMCITPDLYVGIWHIPRMIQNRRDWYPSR